MPWHPWRDVRARLLTIVLVALVVALAAATYGFNLLFARTSSRDANALLRARAASEAGLLAVVHGRLRVAERSDDTIADTLVWIFDGRRLVEGPRASIADAPARTLATGPARYAPVPGTSLRLYALPVVIRGRRVGTVVAGISLAPYEHTERTALFGSFALAGSLLVLTAAAVYWLLRSALRPVARMTGQAAAWSERDLDRRFGLGEPHDELTRLAATLDGLLDRIAASLRHERRFSAELSHELRTPLARAIAEAELALRREREPAAYREALEVVLANAQQVARIVEALVLAAQQEAGAPGVADAHAVAADVAEACTAGAAERGVDIAVEPPRAPLRVGLDSDLVERILHPVVENACRYGRSSVRLSVCREATRIVFLVEDDGPGVTAEERNSIFEPGSRGGAGRANGAGAGLGLALARRLARSAAGDVEAQPSTSGGRFKVRLPAA